MKPTLLLPAMLCGVTLGANVPAMNLAVLKHEIVNYHRSGEYNRDIAKIAQQAQKYLQMKIAENSKLSHPHKLAIVFDIDETSLSNFPAEKQMDFGGTMKEINAAEAKGNDPAIQPTLALYRFAIKHHVKVFFITGRLESERHNTVKNLLHVGYKTVAHSMHNCAYTRPTSDCVLYLKPNNYHKHSAISYKSQVRERINHAYEIVLNIGDQASDLKGGHADKTYKYPNFGYQVP